MAEINFLSKPTNPIQTLGLGVFDGFHLGHKALSNNCDALLTFYPHPEFVLRKDTTLKLLTTIEERKAIFKNMFIIEFTKDFSKLTATQFLEDVIKKEINPKKIIVGYDFCFGYKREGDLSLLKDWGTKNNIEIETIEPFKHHGVIVKSSHIRESLKEGRFDEAIANLGHPYLIKGEVVEGENRGSKIGFPTANVQVDAKKLVPASGVYEGTVFYQDQKLKAAIYIGKKPTFGNFQKHIEVHILNFNKQIYGDILSVWLCKKIRSEKKFNSTQDLINQIQKDVKSII
ncbi:riboflavin biosynthesis protein RibF [Candidatus Marinamargulisbacteria bacterium SCGC AAA071-K20]|nr:riboflavin biosynthesis protein RibF [Candidatus Marinamargulisbacteria bacterium SCGC AAA071-K20]